MGNGRHKDAQKFYWQGLKNQKKKEGISVYSGKIKLKTFSRLTQAINVASIYFITSEYNLCQNDRTELNKLSSDVCYLLHSGFQLEVLIYGGADLRGGEVMNKKLGKDRARSVFVYLSNRIKYDINTYHKGERFLKSLTVSYESVGEDNAAHPGAGTPFFKEIISRDRRVDVFIKNKDFKPPISIAVIGNLPEFNRDIERLEINNLGKVFVHESAIAAGSVIKEQKYQIKQQIRKREIDYQLATVVIKVECSLSIPSNVNVGYVKCMAYNKIDNSFLFPAFARTDKISLKNRTVYIYTHPQSSGRDIIVRRVYKNRNPDLLKEGYKEQKKIISYNDFGDPYKIQFLFLLLDEIYNQLRGGYKNIKTRVEHILGYQ